MHAHGVRGATFNHTHNSTDDQRGSASHACSAERSHMHPDAHESGRGVKDKGGKRRDVGERQREMGDGRGGEMRIDGRS